MTDADLEDLRRAKQLLEHLSFAGRLANAAGRPIEQVTSLLPHAVSDSIVAATNLALRAALGVAVRSLGARRIGCGKLVHRLAVGATGAIGGAFGLPAIALELPASTTLMLRSIADVAQAEGESLESPETRLACLQVFALGGPSSQDDAADTGYFGVRATMAKALEEAAQHIVRYGTAHEAGPILLRFATQVAARFGVPVSQKILAQSMPVIGAVGGATINIMFLAHFQQLAEGHFIVRRLERKYGAEPVRIRYITL